MTGDMWALEPGEYLLGHWSAHYRAPCGFQVPGRLVVTDRRVLFAGPVAEYQLGCFVSGPIDSAAAATALDLDVRHVHYAGGRLSLSIPRQHIEHVGQDCFLLDRAVCLTLRDNGSTHVLHGSLLPSEALARMIGSTPPTG